MATYEYLGRDLQLSKLLLGGAAASANATLAVLGTKTIAVPASGSTWNAIELQASTLTLAAGGASPSELAAVRFKAPVITAGAGSAYTVPVSATVIIDGPPTASAGGGATPTITNPLALYVKSGYSSLGTRVGIGILAPTAYVHVYAHAASSADPTLLLLQDSSGTTGAISLCNGGAAGTFIPYTVFSARGVSARTIFAGDVDNDIGSVPIFELRATYNSGNPTVRPLFDFTYGGANSVMRVSAGGNILIGTTTDVASSRLRVLANKSVVSEAGAVWNGIDFAASTLTLTSASTPVTALAFLNVAGPTITAASAVVTTDFYTVRIGKASFAGAGPASATRQWALGLFDSVQIASGNLVLGTGISAGTNANSTLVLHNGATAPNASADLCHLYCADNGADHATLAVCSEEVVAAVGAKTVTEVYPMFINGVLKYVALAA